MYLELTGLEEAIVQVHHMWDLLNENESCRLCRRGLGKQVHLQNHPIRDWPPLSSVSLVVLLLNSLYNSPIKWLDIVLINTIIFWVHCRIALLDCLMFGASELGVEVTCHIQAAAFNYPLKNLYSTYIFPQPWWLAIFKVMIVLLALVWVTQIVKTSLPTHDGYRA